MKMLEKSQVFRDPIYGYITVKYEVISKLIDTFEFQRLRRIKQLAGVSMIYPSAEHSRFSHCLGVYHLATTIIKSTEIANHLNEREQLLFLVSALLHDIGHGPYSHAFEDVFETDHEKIGAEIIVNSKNITEILSEIDSEFATNVSEILLKKGKYPIIEQLISSQLDIDRLDYLVRDTYFTGAFYGIIDVDKIIRSIRVLNNQVVFKESGLSAIESYLISRYHMYNQVYFHKSVRAYELILEKIYLRIKDLINEGLIEKTELIAKFIKEPFNIETYLKIDDYYINGLIGRLKASDDQYLKTLVDDFINRNIWDSVKQENFESSLIENYSNKEIKYYTATKVAYQKAYQELTKNIVNNIYVLTDDLKIVPLSTQSKIISSLLNESPNKRERFFFRKWKNKFLLLKVRMIYQD